MGGLLPAFVLQALSPSGLGQGSVGFLLANAQTSVSGLEIPAIAVMMLPATQEGIPIYKSNPPTASED